jgi:hypothetical protein
MHRSYHVNLPSTKYPVSCLTITFDYARTRIETVPKCRGPAPIPGNATMEKLMAGEGVRRPMGELAGHPERDLCKKTFSEVSVGIVFCRHFFPVSGFPAFVRVFSVFRGH